MFLVPLTPNATKTRAPGTRHGLCANRMGQGVLHFASFFRSFSDWQKTATGFFLKTGHKPFSKGICQKKDIKKACRAYSLAFTFRDISRKPERANARSGGLSVYSSLGPSLGQISGQVLEQILSQPMADRHWKIKQEVAREYMASPCQGAFHV